MTARKWLLGSGAAVLGLGGYVGAHLVCFGLTRPLGEVAELMPVAGRFSPALPLPGPRAPSSGRPGGRGPVVLKVMSYNLNHVSRGYDKSPDPEPRFTGAGLPEWEKTVLGLSFLVRDPGRVERHLGQIVGLIRSEDPDIVFLQEADRDVAESRRVDTAVRIARAAGFKYAIWGPKWSMDFGVVRHVSGNAILSRYAITSAENVPLNRLTFLRRCVGLHTALVATVNVAGERVRLINTHLYSKKHGYAKKAEQVRRLLRLVRDSPDPVIWGGDLNSSFKRLHSQRPARNDPTLDLVCRSGLVPLAGFFDAATLDYILLREGDSTHYRGQRMISPVATDHHIVVVQVEVEVPGSPAPIVAASLGATVPGTSGPPGRGAAQVERLMFFGFPGAAGIPAHPGRLPAPVQPVLSWPEVAALVYR